MAWFLRMLAVGTLCASLLACATSSSATVGRKGDLARVLEHAAELKAQAGLMVQAARGGPVVKEPDAKQAYEAMVAIAASDQPWLASADLPSDVRSAYQRVLKNVELNADKLTDGSNADFFTFLGQSLAPLWIKDIDALRGLASPGPASRSWDIRTPLT